MLRAVELRAIISIVPTYVKGKGFVLREEDLALVLATARKNGDSWKRCQTLAEVAWHTKDPKQFDKIVEESLAAAREQKHPNRIVSVAAAPAWVMANRSHRRLSSVVAEMLDVISQEPNAVRRGDALILLFEAVYYSKKERDDVLGVLLKTCAVMDSWKKGHILAEAAVTLAVDDKESSNRILELMGEDKFSRRARREIESGYVGPHAFLPFFERKQQGCN